MEIQFRLAEIQDLDAYTILLQQVYRDAYTNVGLGLTQACFSLDVFRTPNTQEYLLSNLRNSETQRTWLAVMNNTPVGAITILDRGSECELRGFYVATNFQGQGIGKQLFMKAKQFSAGKSIILDIYAHNLKTIALYKKWGFVIDETKTAFYRHWPEWPEGLQAKCIYMTLPGTG